MRVDRDTHSHPHTKRSTVQMRSALIVFHPGSGMRAAFIKWNNLFAMRRIHIVIAEYKLCASAEEDENERNANAKFNCEFVYL